MSRKRTDVCTKCDALLDEGTRIGNTCRECVRAYYREWIKTPKGRAKAKRAQIRYGQTEHGKRSRKSSTLKSDYGIDIDDYEAMIAAQNNKCAVCARDFSDPQVKPCVDHCHETLVVRGILCAKCNVGLGWFRDNALALQSAIKYLNVRGATHDKISNFAVIGEPPESRTHEGPGVEPDIDAEARIEAFATVDAGCERATRIGKSWLFKHSHVGHDAIIGDGCEISTGVVIGGYVEVGDNVRIGINATIRPRVKIGEGAMIGMGAVVVKDVPAGETWIGCPARNMLPDAKVDPLWLEWDKKNLRAIDLLPRP